jgi:integrase
VGACPLPLPILSDTVDACFKAHAACIEKRVSKDRPAVNQSQGNLYFADLIKASLLFSWLRRCAASLYFRGMRNVVTLYAVPDTPYVFVSERGGPLTARAVRHIVLRAGQVAGLAFPIHPHMLRHACGFYLANKGIDTRAIQHYLGHCNIQHTVRYTRLTPHRFTAFWDD